jgi:hypothetical protein
MAFACDCRLDLEKQLKTHQLSFGPLITEMTKITENNFRSTYDGSKYI